MKTCGACGVENPDIARFCLACGTQLADAPAAQEMRKVVTIVFSDLKGSTSLGEALDSEALREVMTRYFDAMRGELERHGGVIEKFIGDAVMAVFGLPRLHEDDALRAVRAAAGMQGALEELNMELETFYGVQLTNRTGVNTGEVVAGDPTSGQRLVTGDAVNVAARLEQAAGEREVLIGELTYRLVRDAVDVEEVEPLALKGKSEPVPAYRLVRVREPADAEAPQGARFVGRSAEVAELEAVLEEAMQSGRARLVTIVGDAGVGKSRLTAELLQRTADRALTLAGRCLPYGDGITFWPVAEALRTVAGIYDEDDATEARAKLAALADAAGDGVTDRLSSAMGLNVEPFPVEEVFWAVRRLVQELAKDRPVVFVVEDIHWAEPTMLGLIEHLFQTVDAPVVIACPTRPELLEHNPTWGAGHGATRIVLDPLDSAESTAMIQGLLGGGELEESVVERVVEAAEGNPLFAEQLLRMLTDEGLLELQDGTWRAMSDLSEIHVPPTIQALLASRLDTLSTEQRSVIEPASVVGYEFAEGAVTALAPPDVSPRVRTELTTLGHKHLVRRVDDGDEGMHRFHHIMIRDTAYDGILKRARADLHARFVAWADLLNKDRATEFEEILGYHLEQAWTYLSELGPLDERGREIGQEGSRRLAAAGRRAFARGDVPSAVALLGRAVALLPADDPERVRLLPEHGEALFMTGRYQEATAVLDEAIADDERFPAAAARASIVRLLVQLRMSGPEGWQPDAVERELADAMAVFERQHDEGGLAMAWRLRAWVAGIACRFEDAADASERARNHAQLAGDPRQERRAATGYATAALLGPTPVDEAIARCELAIEQTTGDRQSEGQILWVLASLYAMQGSFDHARGLIGRSRSLFEELELSLQVSRVGLEAWRVELLAGNLDAAEEELRRTYDALDAIGERYLLSSVAGLLAQTLLERDELDEAETLGERSRGLSTEDDVDSQALWRCVQGRVLARRGAHEEAVQLVREAVELLATTDAIVLQIEAQLDFGEVLIAAGMGDEARAAYETAHELAERKGSVVLLGTALRRLEELDTAPA